MRDRTLEIADILANVPAVENFREFGAILVRALNLPPRVERFNFTVLRIGPRQYARDDRFVVGIANNRQLTLGNNILIHHARVSHLRARSSRPAHVSAPNWQTRSFGSTCKLNGDEPYAWLKSTLEKFIQGPPTIENPRTDALELRARGPRTQPDRGVQPDLSIISSVNPEPDVGSACQLGGWTCQLETGSEEISLTFQE